MSDEKLRRAIEGTAAATAYWPREREQAVKRSVDVARRAPPRDRRPLRRPLLSAVAAAGIVTASVLVGLGWRPGLDGPARPRPPAEAPGALAVTDGSLARREPGALLRRVSAAEERDVLLALDRGAAEFRVATRPSRRFRVYAGDVTVEVRGTKFRVDLLADKRAAVAVREGRVAVSWPGHRVELGAGEGGVFPPEAPVGAPAAPAASEPAPLPKAAAPAPRPKAKGKGWRELARSRDFSSAYRALERAGHKDVADEPNDLLLAADVARLSHHPERAVWPLERIVQRHADDRRAPVAAFTLGRVLIEDLGRAGAAAEAFARARALAPRGALGEHALVREIEARARAGDQGAARRLADEYRRAHPRGAFLPTVDRLVGGAGP